jgi:hypothetical protein
MGDLLVTGGRRGAGDPGGSILYIARRGRSSADHQRRMTSVAPFVAPR